MSGSDIGLTLGALLLVLIAGLLGSVEAAITRVSRVRVEELVRDGRRGATKLQRVVSDSPRYVNVLLLIRLAAELWATALVTVVIVDWLGTDWRALLLAGGAMTVVSYVFLGVAPRTLGRQHADRIGRLSAGVTLALARILGPLPHLLILFGNALTPGKGFREGPFASEAELRDLVDLAEERQLIEPGERAMIHSVFELGDTIAREVMVPRPDIVFIERDKTVRQAINLALRSGFSRIPVVGENEDDVVGILYLKDLARRSFDGKDETKVEELMRSVYFVPDSKPADDLLREMQQRRQHVAIVVDEYGGTAGMVTIEDILEEIVGEIEDEYDREQPRVEQVDDNTYRVTARLSIDDLAELFGVALEVEDVETVGGLLAAELGRVPIPGATVTCDGLVLTAESAKGRRNKIGTVLVRRAKAS